MIPPHILDQRYRTFYELSPDFVCTLDENGIILDANKRMLEHFDYSKIEIVGKPCFDFITPEYKKTALDGFKEMIEKGIGPLIEIQLRKKDGTTFFGVCRGARIEGELLESGIYLITIQDVSLIHEALEKAKHAEEQVEKKYAELKKTYDTIIAAEAKYRNLYENSPDLLRTIDLNGIITDCNRAYATSLGYSRDEIIGVSTLDHTAEISLTEMSLQLKEWRMTGGKIINKEIWLKRKDQTIFPALLSGTNIYGYDDKVIGRTVSLRDMTEIYEVRETLEK